MMKNILLKVKKEKGITLVALVVTIIVLLILSGIVITLIVGNNGLFTRAKESAEEHIKQEASEVMNLKISGIQIQSYTENQKLPDLQYLADRLCEDDEMQYVIKKEKEKASLDKIDVSNVDSIFTKIKKYPYEFEINSHLQLASIDGVKLATDDSNIAISKEELKQLKLDIEELKDKVEKNKGNIENNKSSIELLEDKTKMRTVNSGIHALTLKTSTWAEVESYIATEDCYAIISGCVEFATNDSIECTAIRFEKNGEFLCQNGKGGRGGTTQWTLCYALELKKGDKISLIASQYTGATIKLQTILNTTYFPK